MLEVDLVTGREPKLTSCVRAEQFLAFRYGYVKPTPKLRGSEEHHFIVLLNSMGQESEKRSELLLCSGEVWSLGRGLIW